MDLQSPDELWSGIGSAERSAWSLFDLPSPMPSCRLNAKDSGCPRRFMDGMHWPPLILQELNYIQQNSRTKKLDIENYTC